MPSNNEDLVQLLSFKMYFCNIGNQAQDLRHTACHRVTFSGHLVLQTGKVRHKKMGLHAEGHRSKCDTGIQLSGPSSLGLLRSHDPSRELGVH